MVLFGRGDEIRKLKANVKRSKELLESTKAQCGRLRTRAEKAEEELERLRDRVREDVDRIGEEMAIASSWCEFQEEYIRVCRDRHKWKRRLAHMSRGVEQLEFNLKAVLDRADIAEATVATVKDYAECHVASPLCECKVTNGMSAAAKGMLKILDSPVEPVRVTVQDGPRLGIANHFIRMPDAEPGTEYLLVPMKEKP